LHAPAAPRVSASFPFPGAARQAESRKQAALARFWPE
jgi:hypothetical protein